VSSFGFSGTNAHVIVEEAPVVERKQRECERPLHLLTVSARSEAALEVLWEGYEAELGLTGVEHADLCYTANAGRSHFEERAAYVGGREVGRGKKEEVPAVVFLFPGQGAQYAGGRELYETQPVFRRVLDECRKG
jgi:acyl transferase domain-containing protein